MKKYLRIAFSAGCLALASLLPSIARSETMPCFSIRLELKMTSSDGNMREEHLLASEYRPTRFGDGGFGSVTPGTENNCDITGMRPGQKRRFSLASVHGTAVGWEGSSSGTSSIDQVSPDSEAYAEVERKAQGASIRFEIMGVPYGEGSEQYIGNCAAQLWEPFPAEFQLTEEEIADFGKINKTLQLTLPYGENDCTGTGVATLAVAVLPAHVTLEGCSEIGVDEQAVVVASGEPTGGTYRFFADPPSTLQVTAQDATAKIRGVEPGRTTLHVEYTTPGGKSGRASIPVTCLRIESINGGQPIPKIGLFDITGKRTPGILSVPVSILPAGSGDLLTYKPENPGILTTVGRDDSILIQGVTTGKTTFQAATHCGGQTGPVITAEVVPCDDKVKATLAEEERIINEELQRLTKEDERIRSSKEFQDADRIGDDTADLAIKTGGLIIGALSSGNVDKSVKTAADLYSFGSNLRDGLGGDVGMAVFQTALMAGKQALLDLTASGYDTLKAATQFGNDLGSMIGVADRLAANAKMLEQWHRLKLDVERRKKICRNSTEKTEPPKKGDSPPKTDKPQAKEDPAPQTEPQPAENEPPLPADDLPEDKPSLPSDDLPEDEPPGSPPPVSSAGPVGLPYEEANCGCSGSRRITPDASGVASLSAGIKNLKQCVDAFRDGPLTRYQETLQEWTAVLSEAEKVGSTRDENREAADQLGTRMDSLLARTTEFDEQAHTFYKGFQSCPKAMERAITILKSSSAP